jgi:hypothetical protein
MSGEARPSPAYYIALGLLVVGLIAGLSLFLLLTTRPHSNTASVEVSTATGTSCAVGGHATSCYRFTVNNTGSGPAFASCEVTAESGTQATFESGATVQPVNLLEGSTRDLIVRVVADGSDTLAEPYVTCAANSV